MDTIQWITVRQIAERLQVHPETVRRWLRDGRLAGRNFGGKSGYRVRQEQLELFLNGEQAPQSSREAR